MNIKRRLLISNALMIVVPVVVALVVGAGAVGAAWFALSRGSGIGVDGHDDFATLSEAAFSLVDHLATEGGIDDLEHVPALERMLDASGIALVIEQDGAAPYVYGDLSDADRSLIASATGLGSNVDLTVDGRCVSARTFDADGTPYRAYLLGQISEPANDRMKIVVGIAAAALVIAVALAAFATNRFLSLFVLKHITEPLDELASGARRIRDGNLDARLPSGRTDEFAPVFSDFNDMAHRLETSVERDRRIEEERRTLLIGLSHDLRSPLTSIRAYAEGLRDGIANTPEAQQRYLGMIEGKAEEMSGLLARISDVARLDRVEEQPNLATSRLDELVAAWTAENEPAYRLRGVRTSVELAPTRARFDAELTARMLTNLFDNCARYATAGTGSCDVTLTCGDSDGAPCIAVDDSGPGVTDAARGRLFDLFYRGDEARSVTSEGSGIGLAVVSRGMQQMGGEARALRSARGGLRIELRFPPVDAADSERSQA